MLKTAIYDPAKTYEENCKNGPYGAFANTKPQETNGKPKYKFLGFPIDIPFGIAAGSLPTSRFTNAAFDMGFAVSCYKTRRSVDFPANEWPNVLFVNVKGDLTLEKAKKPLEGSMEPFEKDENKYSITNSFGNPSQDASVWAEDMNKAVKHTREGQLMIASVVGTIREGFSPEDYYDDFVVAAKAASDTGARVIELNLSCPNVASEGVLCYSPDAVLAICKKTRKALGEKPIVVKFGYFSHHQQSLLEEIIESISPYINAVSAINTIPAAVVDKKGNQALPGKGRLTSGICGACVKWAGLDMVGRLNAMRKEKGLKFEIIGVGGVATPVDFLEYRKAGADVVQSVTAAMWNPYLAQQIKKSLGNRE